MFDWSPRKKERGKVIHRDKGWEFFQTVGRHQSTDCRCIVNFKQDEVREKHAWCLQSKTVKSKTKKTF